MAGERGDVMRKVQALLDKAASTTFDAERDSLLAKADALMMRHSIEEVELAAAARGRNHGPIKPELRDLFVSEAEDYDVASSLRDLFYRLSRHVGVKLGPFRDRDRVNNGWTYKVIGYPADIDYLQMLFLNLQMHFLSKMEPRPDSSLTDLENFTNLWESGMSYERIFNTMGWPWGQTADGRLIPETRKILRPMRSAYQAACKAEGRQPIKGMKGVTYSKSFIRGYVTRINARLDEMAAARTEAAKGHEVALFGRDSDLNEFFWDMFPDMRPHPAECECDDCHFPKCHDEECTRPRCVAWRKDRNKPTKYREPKQVKVDARGYQRGRDVANSADLSGPGSGVGGSGGSLK